MHRLLVCRFLAWCIALRLCTPLRMRHPNRRSFLAATAAVCGGALLPAAGFAAQVDQVRFDDRIRASDVSLKLRGAALFYYKLFIKVAAAGLYLDDRASARRRARRCGQAAGDAVLLERQGGRSGQGLGNPARPQRLAVTTRSRASADRCDERPVSRRTCRRPLRPDVCSRRWHHARPQWPDRSAPSPAATSPPPTLPSGSATSRSTPASWKQGTLAFALRWLTTPDVCLLNPAGTAA